MNDVISLQGLQKKYGDVVAVNGIDLSINEGEFFTILGPSGSGKTTVLRMIAGLEQPTGGKIHLEGDEVTDVPPYDRDINTVFQDYALFPHMTVGENIAYGLELRGEDDKAIQQRVDGLLELVSLSGTADRQVDELSGGQQQRVALARALAIEPQALLLDEPLGALDEKLRREMQIELKEIQEELGTTFIYVTHDQEEALSMSDRLAVMDEGNVIQIGTPSEVYEAPRTPFIARFFRGSNIYAGNVTTVGDDTVVIEALTTEIEAQVPEFSLEKSTKFFVRSENLTVGTNDNTVSGIIENVVYRGALTDYTIRLGENNIIIATLSTTEYNEDEELTVGWAREDTVLLHPDTS